MRYQSLSELLRSRRISVCDDHKGDCDFTLILDHYDSALTHARHAGCVLISADHNSVQFCVGPKRRGERRMAPAYTCRSILILREEAIWVRSLWLVNCYSNSVRSSMQCAQKTVPVQPFHHPHLLRTLFNFEPAYPQRPICCNLFGICYPHKTIFLQHQAAIRYSAGNWTRTAQPAPCISATSGQITSTQGSLRRHSRRIPQWRETRGLRLGPLALARQDYCSDLADFRSHLLQLRSTSTARARGRCLASGMAILNW